MIRVPGSRSGQPRRGRRSVAASAIVCCGLAVALVACSNDADSSRTTVVTVDPALRNCTSAPPVLRVDLLADAVAAVEAERGGPQRYYEINATAKLVNLFVVGATSDEVVPYVYLADGELSSTTPSTGASGNTFAATAIDIDPRKVTSCVTAQLPGARIDTFDVLGGPNGAVQYSVIATSSVGGQLIAVVAGDGAVQTVEPVDS